MDMNAVQTVSEMVKDPIKAISVISLGHHGITKPLFILALGLLSIHSLSYTHSFITPQTPPSRPAMLDSPPPPPAHPSGPSVLRIDVITDPICPWSYVVYRRLERCVRFLRSDAVQC